MGFVRAASPDAPPAAAAASGAPPPVQVFAPKRPGARAGGADGAAAARGTALVDRLLQRAEDRRLGRSTARCGAAPPPPLHEPHGSKGVRIRTARGIEAPDSPPAAR